MLNSRTVATLCVVVSSLVVPTATQLPAQMAWTKVEHGRNRYATAAAYDSVRKRLVVFGGYTAQTGVLDDTLEWDGQRWHVRKPAQRPPGRGWHAMAFDAARGRVVLFGGGDNPPFGDTWEWDGTNWLRRQPTRSPSARYGHTLAYDEVRKRVVLFGGLTGGFGNKTVLGDTWEWDGTDWTNRTSTSAPAARFGHAMAFDLLRRKIVLHGGGDAPPVRTVYRDTWEWDGRGWTIASTTGPARLHHAMAASLPQAGVVFHGGIDESFVAQDSPWRWDGRAWRGMAAGDGPPARSAHCMAYDTDRAKIMVFGGQQARHHGIASLWELDRSWRLVDSGPHPPGVGSIVEFRGQVLAFGDLTPNDSTWTFASGRWRKLSPSRRPSGRIGAGMANDVGRDRVVLFGGNNGFGGGDLGETWEWDGANWRRVVTAVEPPPRSFPTMTYDSRRKRTVLFGGSAKGVPLADAWEFDGQSWRSIRTPALLQGFPGRSMAFDARRGVVVLFVNRGVPGRGVTWEYDGSRWTLRSTANSPMIPASHSMVYDAAREKILLLSSVTTNDYWEYDGNDWRPAPGTSPARGGRQVYDAVADRVVVFDNIWQTWIYANQQPARVDSFGQGCRGTVGVPQLGLDDNRRPWIGSTYRIALTNIPSNAPALLVSGVSRSTWGGASLPLNLAVVGMPGCGLLASVDFTTLLVARGTRAEWSAVIPASASLLGGVAYQQAFVGDGGANSLGVVASNALAARIGQR